MKKIILTILYIVLYYFSTNAQVIITEIMYNSPDIDDVYEYLELYNSSNDTINLEGYKFVDGIEHTFKPFQFNPKSYLLIVKDSTLLESLNIDGIVWDKGGLKNKGETIILADSFGVQIDSVSYSDRGDWISSPDGDGPSLELCDYTKDNSIAENWKAAISPTGIMTNNTEILGTPGKANTASCENYTADYTITASGTSFSPNSLTIYVGETVQWENLGGTHNVNGSLDIFSNNPEGFYSGPASTDNWTFEFTFNKTGKYEYQCDAHASIGMKGEIIVIEKEKASLVITEFLYNDNGSQDSLEFIEIFNAGEDTVFLKNFNLKTKAIDYTFPNYYLKAKQHLVVCKNPNRFNDYMGYYPLSWGLGGLNNKEDTITLLDDKNNIIDFIAYKDTGVWDTKADGQGYSLVLCDYTSNNNDGNNWQSCPIPMGIFIDGVEIHANPGRANYCEFDIDILKETDSLGVITKSNVKSFISGVVYGTNFNKEGLQFVIKDDSNNGLWVYSKTKSFGYDFHEGDKVELWGKNSQYFGLSQIKLDSIVLIQKDSILDLPIIAKQLNEETEGQLVILKDVKLLDYTRWTNTGSGFNVKVYNEDDTFAIRIDKDIDLYGMPHPVGVFDIIGLGGQFDKSAPYLDHYQLFPRYIKDISPYNSEKYQFRTIGEVTQNDDEGVGISLGEFCEIRGLVFGGNLKPSGLQFTIIDEHLDGIGVYSKNEKFGYTVKEGDYISIKGVISQYNGLLQIIPDTIITISKDHTVYSYQSVTELNEETESQLVKIKNLTLKTPSEWKGDGSSFNVIVTDGTNEYVLRIDNDIDLSTKVAPNNTFNLIGIGGQYDNTSPYLEGYQILPRYSQDIEKVNSVTDINNSIKIFPNPVGKTLNIDIEDESIYSISIYNNLGQMVNNTKFRNSINVDFLDNGFYKVLIKTNKRTISKAFIKY